MLSLSAGSRQTTSAPLLCGSLRPLMLPVAERGGAETAGTERITASV
jgi:hypothetical protein